MKKKSKILVAAVITIIVIQLIVLLTILVQGHNVPVLNPQGSIADKQRDLMVVATVLMLIVVVPVFILTGYIAWKYRETNHKATYKPKWDSNLKLETIWWGLPLAIIIILSVIIVRSSHELDPYKPLESTKKPVTIQVIALQWKWLFIYPEQNIATVNYVQFPEDTPVNFEITADAPMNSFWIPSLGGQVYAMAGMTTKLHLMANKQGTYNGASANLSGEGFAGMKFKAESVTQSYFDSWVGTVQSSSTTLSDEEYAKLIKPSKDNPAATYASWDRGLYDKVVMKYMMPSQAPESSNSVDHGGEKHHNQ